MEHGGKGYLSTSGPGLKAVCLALICLMFSVPKMDLHIYKYDSGPSTVLGIGCKMLNRIELKILAYHLPHTDTEQLRSVIQTGN